MALYAGYHYKEFYTTPSLRYFYLYLAATIILFGYAVFLTSRAKARQSNWVLVVIYVSFPLFLFSTKLTIDIPRTLYFDGKRYDIPWEFHPTGGHSKRGDYVGIGTFYPEFSQPIGHKKREGKFGYAVRFTRMSRLDTLCVGIYGGCYTVPGGPKSTLPTSQQVNNAVTDHLTVSPNTNEIQSIWVDTKNGRTLFFNQNGVGGKAKTFGSCTREPSYLECNYLIDDGKNFYNVSVNSKNPTSIHIWNEKEVLPTIEREAKKLLDSFVKE